VPCLARKHRTSRRNRALRGGIVIVAAATALAVHTENAPASSGTSAATTNAPATNAPATNAPATNAPATNTLATNAATVSSGSTNVPDAVTRKTGLRVEPMTRPARIYAENCEGCHGWAGVSVTEIPTLKGRIGYFARIPEGRRYLMQVPNVALNPSSDEDIAAMMNWLLATFSREQLPADFVPYTAQEVAALRTARIDVAADRRRVVAALVAANELPSPDALSNPRASLY
jgi:mono/diheme cytochrome c family protein